MKELLVFIGCIGAFASLARPLAPSRLAPSVYPDTESSTNVTCVLDQMSLKLYTLSLELFGTPSNNVEVAVGHDADGDGHLSFDEAALVLAWDCGAWTAAGRGGSIEPTVVGPDTNGVMTATVEVPIRRHRSNPTWLYDRTWNLLRVTARGVDTPLERICLETRVSGTLLILR